jgi:uncharacterized protein YecT (DUF1311 family)
LHGKGGIQRRLRSCIRDEWDKLDQQLNANYRAALARTPSHRTREQLRNEQRRWLKDSQQECFDDMQSAGHTPYELALHECEIEELVRRVAWLRRLAHR